MRGGNVSTSALNYDYNIFILHVHTLHILPFLFPEFRNFSFFLFLPVTVSLLIKRVAYTVYSTVSGDRLQETVIPIVRKHIITASDASAGINLELVVSST